MTLAVQYWSFPVTPSAVFVPLRRQQVRTFTFIVIYHANLYLIPKVFLFTPVDDDRRSVVVDILFFICI